MSWNIEPRSLCAAHRATAPQTTPGSPLNTNVDEIITQHVSEEKLVYNRLVWSRHVTKHLEQGLPFVVRGKALATRVRTEIGALQRVRDGIGITLNWFRQTQHDGFQ